MILTTLGYQFIQRRKLSAHRLRSRSVCLPAGRAGRVLRAEAARRLPLLLLPPHPRPQRPLELLLPLRPLHVQVEEEVVGLVVLRARRIGVALLEVGRLHVVLVLLMVIVVM